MPCTFQSYNILKNMTQLGKFAIHRATVANDNNFYDMAQKN